MCERKNASEQIGAEGQGEPRTDSISRAITLSTGCGKTYSLGPILAKAFAEHEGRR